MIVTKVGDANLLRNMRSAEKKKKEKKKGNNKSKQKAIAKLLFE